MSAILIMLLLAAAFTASVWTLYVSVRPQLHRYRELFGSAPALAPRPLIATRITVRWASAVRQPVRTPLRAAA